MPGASFTTHEGKVRQLEVESEQSRSQFWAVIQTGSSNVRVFGYLDEDATETATALAQFQLLRDAMARDLDVEVKTSERRAVRVIVKG